MAVVVGLTGIKKSLVLPLPCDLELNVLKGI
jgi:hypothetical protein